MASVTQVQARRTSSHRKRKLLDQLIAYSYIAPNFIGFAVFTLVPLVFALALSFMNWDGANSISFAGLDNFRRLFRDKVFIKALINTLVYTAATVPLTLVASLALALLLNSRIFARNFFRTVSFFPYVASLVAVAAVWNMLFSPSMGPVNMLLSKVFKVSAEDLPRWAADKDWAMTTVVMFSIWKYMGYYMVIFLAGLQNTNPELYEAAALDGANPQQKFWHVTLPQLRPTTFFVLMMLIITSFKVYDIIYNITQGGPGNATMVLVYYIYNTAFVSWDLGYASAISMVLFLLVLGITLLQFRGERHFDDI